MDKQSAIRRLAAILAIDTVGYTRLMAVDESGTYKKLQLHLAELVDPAIWQYRGRTVKNTGDGLLVEFASVFDAILCAITIQRGMIERNQKEVRSPIQFRSAVNIGEIIVENDDIFGDGVNVAARLEALAEPGGICISQAASEQIRDKLELELHDLGDQVLRNIPRPVRVFSIPANKIATLDVFGVQPKGSASFAARVSPVPNRKPTIAVLPFSNISSDSSNDYFADGIVEDIITALSHFRNLFVIARNSSFAFKGRTVDPRRIATALGVRYLVEGSVQRANERVRITAQLIDTELAGHLWADRFDGDLSDIFALQDNITQRVVTAIEPKILASEIERAKRKPADSLDAYDYYLRALPLRVALSAEAAEQALQLLKRAIELDPTYAPALAHASACYLAINDQGWRVLTQEEVAEGLRLARAAIEADMDDSVVLCLSGHSIAGFTGDFAAGLAWIDRGLSLNPNYAEGWMRSSMVRVYINDLDEAIEHSRRAIALSPLDPKLYHPLCAQGFAFLFRGEFDDAAAAARRALMGKQKPEMAFRILITALKGLDRHQEMQSAAKAMMTQFPSFRITTWRNRSHFSRDARLDVMVEALQKAGIPM